MHETDDFSEGYYYGYFLNCVTDKRLKLDYCDVEEVKAKDVMNDTYKGKSNWLYVTIHPLGLWCI